MWTSSHLKEMSTTTSVSHFWVFSYIHLAPGNRKRVVKKAQKRKHVKHLHCTLSFPPYEKFGFFGFCDSVIFFTPLYDICSCTGADVEASAHPRLAVGSHVAAELREAIYSKLGLTGCAGIATNKLLAKLVSGIFKPNQQTSLLPENISDIIDSLSSLRKVPGGHV